MQRLSSVPEPPPAASNKPKTFEDTMRAIYADKRAGHEARELLLAVSYGVMLAERKDASSPLNEARRVLGRNRIGKPRYDDLMAADAPRYEPPREASDWGPGGAPSCEAPRLRPYRPRPYTPRNQPEQPELPEPTPIRPDQIPPEIAALVATLRGQATIVYTDPGYTPPRDWRTEDGVCGANSHHRVLEKDPRTGWITAHWFCKRHQAHAERVAEQVREQNEAAPEPIPNRGGLLGCFFRADWEKVYRRYAGTYWEPPVYGLCADDWPTPGETLPGRGRLRMVLGGPDLDAPEAS